MRVLDLANSCFIKTEKVIPYGRRNIIYYFIKFNHWNLKVCLVDTSFVIFIILKDLYFLKVNNINTKRRCKYYQIEQQRRQNNDTKVILISVLLTMSRFSPFSFVFTVDFEQVNAHWDYNHSREFPIAPPNVFLRNFCFIKIFMKVLMEKKEKVMDDNPKYMVSKTGLNMLCYAVLVSTDHCFTKIISTYSGMSEDLSDKFS